ncbi:cytochrome b5-like heme/steroid binding domain-containing protein [Aspergillus floccosus]
MGWFSLRHPAREPSSFDPHPASTANIKAHIEHVEHVYRTSKASPSIQQPPDSEYPFQNPTVPDEALPFIPPAVVRAKQQSHNAIEQDRAWIVVDNIVYDCTDYIHEHPGGTTVIRSFLGQDCSWQFWRFHSISIMGHFGRPLRIGRTEGVENRFKEPPRYIGLSRLRSGT